jgi:hypothetical protein
MDEYGESRNGAESRLIKRSDNCFHHFASAGFFGGAGVVLEVGRNRGSGLSPRSRRQVIRLEIAAIDIEKSRYVRAGS